MTADNVRHLREADPRTTTAVVPATAALRDLIPGGETIRRPFTFADDTWDLGGHPTWKTKVGNQTRLAFDKVPLPWRAPVKEWALLCLNPALATTWAPNDPVAQTWPETQEPANPVTVQSNLKQLRLVLTLMDRYDLHEPDEDGWARVATLMRQPQDRSDKRQGTALAPGTLRGRAQQLNSLWSIRTIVGRPTLLGTEPFGGAETTTLFGIGAKPRKNMRRPHEDVGRCLGYVAWVFDHIADDILDHLRWWADNATPPGQGPATQDEGYEAMTSLLHEIATEQACLPGTQNNRGKVTLAHTPMALYLGETNPDEAYLWGRYAMRRFDHALLALDGGNPCPLPVTSLPTSDGGHATWTGRLLPTGDELQWWASALVYYAEYYIAATCGLRDLDLDCLPVDCIQHETKRRPTGETYDVTTMRGYKQKNRTVAVPTEWKVNGRVARIVGVIQQLHDIYGIEATRNTHTGERRLFDSQLITASKRSKRESVHLDTSFMDWLIKGARHLYDRGVIPSTLDDVTRISISTIRITALQAYASRQLGNALVAQFGQWSTKHVSLGYHLDVYKLIHLADPTDAAELQAEHIGRTLQRAARDLDTIRGKGVPRLTQTLERNGRALSNPGPLSPARLKTLGKKNPNIEVGPYTICVFNPDGALCGGQGAADFRLCRPYECRNSAMTLGHRARIELRRRLEMNMAPILRRSAEKIAAAMPDIVQEFEQHSNDQLVRLVAAELDDYIAEALGIDPEESA